MNPWEKFKSGPGSRQQRGTKRGNRLRGNRRYQAAKRNVPVGVLHRKSDLRVGFLNVDGLNELSLTEIKDTLSIKKPDIVVLAETKRREEEFGSDISIEDYDVDEIRRSDVAMDKSGGGLAVYLRKKEGLFLGNIIL